MNNAQIAQIEGKTGNSSYEQCDLTGSKKQTSPEVRNNSYEECDHTGSKKQTSRSPETRSRAGAWIGAAAARGAWEARDVADGGRKLQSRSSE